MEAIIMANALVYASPSHDKTSVNKKQKAWEKFINSLDWTDIEVKSKKKKETNLLQMFTQTGVPVKNK